MATTLSDAEIEEALQDLPGWTHGGGVILKEFTFKGFKSAIAFIDRLAVAADAAAHHPDIENHYNRVKITLHTWDAGGVTEKDVALAREIEAVAEP